MGRISLYHSHNKIIELSIVIVFCCFSLRFTRNVKSAEIVFLLIDRIMSDHLIFKTIFQNFNFTRCSLSYVRISDVDTGCKRESQENVEIVDKLLLTSTSTIYQQNFYFVSILYRLTSYIIQILRRLFFFCSTYTLWVWFGILSKLFNCYLNILAKMTSNSLANAVSIIFLKTK